MSRPDYDSWVLTSSGWRQVSARCEGRWDTPVVETDSLARAATLLRERNAIDVELARLIHRPMTSGHLGEWIAAQIFDIELEASAVAAGIDGRFRSGPLQGLTVNIKWYLKREGLLDRGHLVSDHDDRHVHGVPSAPPVGEVEERPQGDEVRTVPLPPAGREHLAAWLDERVIHDGPLWTGQRGRQPGA